MNRTDALAIVNRSDRGRRRSHNEDSSASDARLGLLVIADGMGGYKAGEVASTLAVTAIMNQLRNTLGRDLGHKHNGYATAASLLRQAVVGANGLIFHTAQTEEVCRGMGTTVLAVLFYEEHILFAHVGDSRLYRLRDHMFEQLTQDHSLSQELVAQGVFTAEQVQASVSKNFITQALGIDAAIQVEIQQKTVQPGDIYLLCTDGLNDMVNDEDIYLTLRRCGTDLAKAGDELIRMANDRGGKDNISVILAQSSGYFSARTQGPRGFSD